MSPSGPGRSPMAAAVVAGLGGWLPPKMVTNDDLARRLDTSDEWIRSRTGISRRHVIEPGMSTAVLATEAGGRALKSAERDSADAVVLATSTPDRTCPATAPEVASRLGLRGVAAFDVGAVCTGFLYGLAVGAGMIGTGVAESVLVIGADAFSTILDPHDRSTAAIFGDGGGAVLLRAGESDEPGAIAPATLGSDGTAADLIMVPDGGSRSRAADPGAPARDPFFRMLGRAVFHHAVLRMSECAEHALERAGWSIGDVDRLVAHQANLRILRAVADRLQLPAERLVLNIERVGNTVAASVPLALCDGAAEGRLRPGHRVLLTAFGGGLSWGATTLVWPDLTPG